MGGHTKALLDVLCKGEEPGADFLREAVRWLVHELMEAEVTAQIGPERYERPPERTTQTSWTSAHPWDTRVATIELAISKLRTGSERRWEPDVGRLP